MTITSSRVAQPSVSDIAPGLADQPADGRTGSPEPPDLDPAELDAFADDESRSHRPRAELIKKIIALRRLAADAASTEGERANAARAAAEMVGKYSITEHELAATASASSSDGDGAERDAKEQPPRPPSSDKEPTNSKADTTQATRIVNMVLGRYDVELWRGDDDHTYATCPVVGTTEVHVETLRVRSKKFRAWLRREFHVLTGKTAGGGAMSDAIEQLDGEAQYGGRCHDIHLRVAGDSQRVVIDLGDSKWRAITITPDGWRVDECSSVRFRRPASMAALPVPVPGGTLALLRPHVRASDEDWPLVIFWLLSVLQPGKKKAILALSGQQDSGKSVSARRLRDVTDPSRAELRSAPRDEQALAIAARSAHVLAFDNLSAIPQWQSDALCRLATGGSHGARTLYSDDEETLLSAIRPIILTSIVDVVGSPDLASRTVVVSVPKLDGGQRTDEGELERKWAADHPLILGALCDAVACALKMYDEVPANAVADSHRMLDAVRWAAAAAASTGVSQDQLLRALRQTRLASAAAAVEDSPIGAAVVKFMDTRIEWAGTATELRDALAAISGVADEVSAKRMKWPWQPRSMTNAIQQLAPALLPAIEYQRPERNDKTRTHRMKRGSGHAKDRPDRVDRPRQDVNDD